jgi:hypothetical protein
MGVKFSVSGKEAMKIVNGVTVKAMVPGTLSPLQ